MDAVERGRKFKFAVKVFFISIVLYGFVTWPSERQADADRQLFVTATNTAAVKELHYSLSFFMNLIRNGKLVFLAF